MLKPGKPFLRTDVPGILMMVDIKSKDCALFLLHITLLICRKFFLVFYKASNIQYTRMK